jgi:hypothetical protein
MRVFRDRWPLYEETLQRGPPDPQRRQEDQSVREALWVAASGRSKNGRWAQRRVTHRTGAGRSGG